MDVYAFVHACMDTCVRTYVRTYVCMYVGLYARTHVSTYVYVYESIWKKQKNIYIYRTYGKNKNIYIYIERIYIYICYPPHRSMGFRLLGRGRLKGFSNSLISNAVSMKIHCTGC